MNIKTKVEQLENLVFHKRNSLARLQKELLKLYDIIATSDSEESQIRIESKFLEIKNLRHSILVSKDKLSMAREMLAENENLLVELQEHYDKGDLDFLKKES